MRTIVGHSWELQSSPLCGPCVEMNLPITWTRRKRATACPPGCQVSIWFIPVTSAESTDLGLNGNCTLSHWQQKLDFSTSESALMSSGKGGQYCQIIWMKRILIVWCKIKKCVKLRQIYNINGWKSVEVTVRLWYFTFSDHHFFVWLPSAQRQ